MNNFRNNNESLGTFINPYNFIPIGNGCRRSERKKGGLTGHVCCTLFPKTDIFIPNTSNENCTAEDTEKVEGHKIREFFSYEQLEEDHCMTEDNAPQHPVIPGSELRGMIRSMYEAFTDSCLSAFDEDKVLSSRTSERKKAGIMLYENGRWHLFKAEANKRHPYNEEKPLFIKSSKGKHYFTYKKAEETDKIEETVPEADTLKKAVENYKIVIKDYYQNEKINKMAKKFMPYTCVKTNEIKPEEGNSFPVWYEILDNKHVYLSPACIGRNIYMNKLTDFIGDYQPCVSREKICETCSLFGFIENEESVSSRIRISDAEFTGEKPEYSKITALQELSGPKITSMEMYTHLINGSERYWTYDYAGYKNKRIIGKGDLSINGRKFYYHHDGRSDKNRYGTTLRTNRNMTVRPLKKYDSKNNTNKFRFNVYFEHITEDELKKLLAVLSLGGNANEHYYKLGCGKPLGMGSIKISVENVYLRNIDPSDCEYNVNDATEKYSAYFSGDMFEDESIISLFGMDDKIFRQIKNMTDFNYNQKSSVHYPASYKKGELVGFQWFVHNRGKISDPKFSNLLGPDGVLDEN